MHYVGFQLLVPRNIQWKVMDTIPLNDTLIMGKPRLVFGIYVNTVSPDNVPYEFQNKDDAKVYDVHEKTSKDGYAKVPVEHLNEYAAHAYFGKYIPELNDPAFDYLRQRMLRFYRI